MVRLPAGTFTMGSNAGAADEKPTHTITLPSFEMDLTEVTVAQYQACVDAHVCRPATGLRADGAESTEEQVMRQFCNGGRMGREPHPINCVDWNEANAYCKWAGKRLPTEEEWEYAARGTDGRTYPWGNEAPGPALLNACGAQCVALAASKGWNWSSLYAADDGFVDTAPVGSFPQGKSPFGLLDMAGNIAEWTLTGYCDSYAESKQCMKHRVTRGGNWSDGSSSFVRTGYRNGSIPEERSIYVGFRCAQ
jgi:formylglycine-generating enzyme required for sulfatase activity